MSNPAPYAVLGRDDLLKLLRRPDFFERCPACQPLQAAATQALAQFQASGKRDCCNQATPFFMPVLEQLLDLLRPAEAAAGQELLTLVSQIRGCTWAELRIYYRRGREPHPERLVIRAAC